MSLDPPITALLRDARTPAGADRLFAAVYPELRRLARAIMRGERAGHTLQPTELVHGAFMKLVDRTLVQAADRVHFLAEIAGHLGVSKRTVDADWALGRLWVARAMANGRAARGGQA